MKKAKKIVVSIIALILFKSGFAQNRTLDSINKLYIVATTDTVKLQLLSDLNWYSLPSDLNKAKTYAFQELDLAKKINHQKFIAQAYNDLGMAYYRLSQSDSALHCYEKSLKIRKIIGDENLIISSLSKISMIFYETGDYNKSLELMFSTLNIYEKQKNTNNCAITLNNIGSIYNRLNSSDKAILYFKKALVIHLQNKNDYEIGSTYFNIGGVYLDLKKYKEAKSNFSLALPFFIQSKDKIQELQIYMGLGKIENALNNLTEAENLMLKALKIAEAEKIDNEILDCKLQLAWLYIDKKQFNRAEKFAKENLNTVDKFSKPKLLDIYKQLNITNTYLGNKDTAVEYLQKYAELKNNIYNEQSSNGIAEAEKKYQVAKKEAENKILQNENEIKTLQNEKNTHIIYLLVALFFVLLLIIFWQISLSRIKKQKQILETEIQLNRDRERISRDLHDSVGGQLSYVVLALEADENIDKLIRQEKAKELASSLRNVTSNLRETIWALNNDKLTITNFSDKLKQYTKNCFTYTSTKINILENIEDDKELNPSLALNLFRICQESVNNAFKYAQGSEFSIIIESGKTIKIILQDNGVGFDITNKKEDSYGLQNLLSRAKEINAQINIQSQVTIGTTITIVV